MLCAVALIIVAEIGNMCSRLRLRARWLQDVIRTADLLVCGLAPQNLITARKKHSLSQTQAIPLSSTQKCQWLGTSWTVLCVVCGTWRERTCGLFSLILGEALIDLDL